MVNSLLEDRFSQRVRRVRESNGKSQEWLSKFIGCTVTTISRVERGKNFPIRNLNKFEEFFKKYDK